MGPYPLRGVHAPRAAASDGAMLGDRARGLPAATIFSLSLSLSICLMVGG